MKEYEHKVLISTTNRGDMLSMYVVMYVCTDNQDIIVLGHYGCGGVKAASTVEFDHGLMEHWLRNIRDVVCIIL